MKVYLSKLAESGLLSINGYLLEEWNMKVKNDFVTKLNKKINQISSQPNSCPESKLSKGLYKCVVTRQVTFYYRIEISIKEIEIITFFNTRQDPYKINKEIYFIKE